MHIACDISPSPSGKTLSKDLQDKVVDRHNQEMYTNKISKVLSMPKSTVTSIIKRWK